MLTVGLVVEGTHDLIMLEPLIAREVHLRFQEDVKFRRLQPIADATGTFNRGGWSRVVAWCQDNAGSLMDTFFEPLFAGDPPCDIIVIHLDGDSLELTNHLRSVPHGLTDPTPSQRVSAIAELLQELLSLEAKRKKRFAYAIPVLQSEAWILGAENAVSDVEKINAKVEFQRTRDRRVHRKLESFYSSRVRAAEGGAGNISRNCESYVEFVSSVACLDLT